MVIRAALNHGLGCDLRTRASCWASTRGVQCLQTIILPLPALLGLQC